MVTVTIEQIRDLSERALLKHGAAPWIAQSVADAVAKAEAVGNLICGLYYLESYCVQLVSGRVNGTVEPVVSKPKPGSVEVDAGFGFAQPAFARGLRVALSTAREMGTASLAIRHAHTCTSLGYFTEQIAEAGLIALGFTNATAVVSPPGGNKAVLGTNPMAMAVPAKGGGVHFQFDQSTSAIALGKITMAKAAGEKIPLGWAVDADGKPTDDPGEALKGSLVSTGGYKGWGLGLMVEVLAACVPGTRLSIDGQPLKAAEGDPHDLGQFYLLIDPEVFAGAAFFEGLARLSGAVEAQEGARLPGAKRVLMETVEKDESLWASLEALAP